MNEKIISYSAFMETKRPTMDGEFCWTLMVKLGNVLKDDLKYEQFAKGYYSVYLDDGKPPLKKTMMEVTLQNPNRQAYGDWYEDMLKGEHSGPKKIINAQRNKVSEIGKNEIFYQWWDWPGVGLNILDTYWKSADGKTIKRFVGIDFNLEFSHKLYVGEKLLFTVIITLTGKNTHIAPFAKDTRMLIVKEYIGP